MGSTRENKRAKDYRLYYEIGGFFLQILPSLCFETHPIKLYGNEKHNAKILSIYLSKFDEKSQNYPSIKVHMKWSLGSSSVSLPEILHYVNI